MTGSPLTKFEEMVTSKDVLDFAVGYPRLTPVDKQWAHYRNLVTAIETAPSKQSQLDTIREGVSSLLGEPIREFAITYSGSIALERTISSLIPNDRTTLMVEPGFDIIDSFVRRATPIPPRYFYIDPFRSREEGINTFIDSIDGTIGAVVLVSPNNPSGLTLSKSELNQVAEACAAVDAILIVDHCFILIDPYNYSPGVAFSLSDRCRWAALWDSSKTIEFLGERFGVISGSRNELASVRNTLAEIQFELPMSSLIIMANAVEELRSTVYLAELKNLVDNNYAQLEKTCSYLDVTINRPDAGSFALIKIDEQRLGNSEAVSRWLLDRKHIGVLPGSLFYMSSVSGCSDFIRVALTRPRENFSIFCEAIVALTKRHLLSMREMEIDRGDRVLRVRDAGDPSGAAVIYFHGTPSSRLELCFGEQSATERGVRLISFDRPGYGGSTPARFGLASIAADAHAIADRLGIAEFATLGLSGGGPGALATATILPCRVTRVGIASGVGPMQLVPGAMDRFNDTGRAAVLLLPDNPSAAALAFADEFKPLAELLRVYGGAGLITTYGYHNLLSARDIELLQDSRFATAVDATAREAFRLGTSGAGWDNVSWVGEWDVDLGSVTSPVLLWYGSDDRLAPPSHGLWLAQNLSRARLVVRDGEGHFGIFEHFHEILDSLTRPDTP